MEWILEMPNEEKMRFYSLSEIAKYLGIDSKIIMKNKDKELFKIGNDYVVIKQQSNSIYGRLAKLRQIMIGAN